MWILLCRRHGGKGGDNSNRPSLVYVHIHVYKKILKNYAIANKSLLRSVIVSFCFIILFSQSPFTCNDDIH